ncbi:MAG: protein kinase [Proteobacteria bacterium]|nr:protein kinase [Pseudomonadota bacterium]
MNTNNQFPHTRTDLDSDESGDLQPGDIVDQKFRIIDRLGEGGMGEVFRAKHLVLGSEIALKILYGTGDYDDVSEQRFLDEARILESLSHSNIVRVRDAGVAVDGFLYITMELLAGGSFRDWMHRTPVKDRDSEYVTTITNFMIDIADGLEEAHEHKIIHRDLKPSNIILHEIANEDGTSSYVPKIIDFGVAKRQDRNIKLTIDGSVPGTEEYIAPEVQLGEDPDARSDVFALGVILYEALTGQKPEITRRDDPVFARAADKQIQVTPANKLNPSVSRELSQACLKALEPRPESRFQTAFEFSSALIELPQSQERTADESDASDDERKERTLRYTMVAAGLIVVAIIVIAIVFWPKHVDEPTVPPSTAETPGMSSDTKGSTEKSATEEDTEKGATEEGTIKATPSPADVESQPAVKHTTGKSQQEEQPIAKTQPPVETEHKSDDVEQQIADGYTALRGMRLEEAEEHFKKAADQNPRASRAWYGLGRVAREKANYQEASNHINKALQIRNNPRWRIELGVAYIRQGQKEKALNEWRRVQKDFPSDAKAQKNAQKNLEKYR